MANQIEPNIPTFGIMSLKEAADSDALYESMAGAQTAALYAAKQNNEVVAVVQIVGFAQPVNLPAEWRTVGTAGSPIIKPVPASTTPVLQVTSEPPAKTEQEVIAGGNQLNFGDTSFAFDYSIGSTSEIQVSPSTTQSARRSPKHPNIRGVDFPIYSDVVKSEDPGDGPATPEQIIKAKAECLRIGGNLDKTLLGWVGLPVERVNAATMDAVIQVLEEWKK